MFAWIQQLLGSENVETAEEASGKLLRRMRQETEGLLSYELEASRGRLHAVARSRAAASRAHLRQRDGAGQA